jgi:hypothetical protein
LTLKTKGDGFPGLCLVSVFVRLVFHLTDLGELFLSGFQFAARAPADIVSAAIFFVVRTPSALSPSRFLGRFSGS